MSIFICHLLHLINYVFMTEMDFHSPICKSNVLLVCQNVCFHPLIGLINYLRLYMLWYIALVHIDFYALRFFLSHNSEK